MKVAQPDVEFVRVTAQKRERDAPTGNGIRPGVVCVVKRHIVELGGHLQRALAFAVAVDGLVDDQRVNHRAHNIERFESVTSAFPVKQ